MEQLDLLKRVVGILDSLGLRYMIVGSYGSGAWGEPRFTYDIDIVVSLTIQDVKRMEKAFPAEEFYLSPEAALQAIVHRGQFNVIHPSSGHKIDFMVEPTDAWGKNQLSRRKSIELDTGFIAYIGAPEDILISKMLYYREGGSEKHLRDMAGILRISGEQVDRGYVERWVQELGLNDIWLAVLARSGVKK